MFQVNYNSRLVFFVHRFPPLPFWYAPFAILNRWFWFSSGHPSRNKSRRAIPFPPIPKFCTTNCQPTVRSHTFYPFCFIPSRFRSTLRSSAINPLTLRLTILAYFVMIFIQNPGPHSPSATSPTSLSASSTNRNFLSHFVNIKSGKFHRSRGSCLLLPSWPYCLERNLNHCFIYQLPSLYLYTPGYSLLSAPSLTSSPKPSKHLGGGIAFIVR